MYGLCWRQRITLDETWSVRGRTGGDAPTIYSESGAVLYLIGNSWLVWYCRRRTSSYSTAD